MNAAAPAAARNEKRPAMPGVFLCAQGAVRGWA